MGRDYGIRIPYVNDAYQFCARSALRAAASKVAGYRDHSLTERNRLAAQHLDILLLAYCRLAIQTRAILPACPAILSLMNSLFHLAFNVTDLARTRQFYGDVLGCREGRSTATWVDFNFFGHQLSMHLGEPFQTAATGHVGDHLVPMPHFGLVLALPDWQTLAQRLQAASIDFILEPQLRFAGQPGEQWTMFFCDPFGNPIEIKGFKSLDTVYAT
jgi:uncharacterized protein